jgi:glycosyltransferase involved in cell wall biosynthesis
MTACDYSTTRRLVLEKPACFNKTQDSLMTLLRTPDSDRKIAEGGLRLVGKYKASAAEMPLITVVTVVFNGVGYLEDTIKSVIGQTYDNLEYIIVDGGSTDGTLDIIRKYEDVIDYWVSEPDRGIYDAMNKGSIVASGEWLNFMNSGDVLFNNFVAEAIFKHPEIQANDLIYGDVEVDYGSFKKLRKSGAVSGLKAGMQFSHQSLFAKRSILVAVGFDVSYRTAADYHFIVSSWINNFRFLQLDLIVSSISSGGVSDTHRWSSHQQRMRILASLLDLQVVDKMQLWGQGLYILGADLFKSILPVWLFDWIKRIK